MKITDLNTQYVDQLATLHDMAATPTLWQAEAAALLPYVTQDYTDTDAMMQTMHELQRLIKIDRAQLTNNLAFKKSVQNTKMPTWQDFTSPPADAALQHALGNKLYNITPGKNDVAEIDLGISSRIVGRYLVERCIQNNVPFMASFDDQDFNAHVLNHADKDGVDALAAAGVKASAPVTKIMSVRAGLRDDDGVRADPVKEKQYMIAMKPRGARISSGELFYTLTRIPSRKDAAIDQIDYDDYIKLFFEMCDQPWDHIDRAQRSLIKEFNAAKTARFTNTLGTDLTMNIDGFTFCNSLIAKNVPGSEIFSAPHKDSVEGKIVSKGRFTREGKIVEDLTLEFNKGRLVSYTVGKGKDVFDAIIGIDDGARYVGEIGIGTNPHLKQHVSNTLLVEKIGGSFHVALGHPYTYTEYGGETVNVNNGNQSALHWDITTMLHGVGGRIYLDDRMVMDDGKWLDPHYDVLNRGWAAVPQADRPAYWKDYTGPK